MPQEMPIAPYAPTHDLCPSRPMLLPLPLVIQDAGHAERFRIADQRTRPPRFQPMLDHSCSHLLLEWNGDCPSDLACGKLLRPKLLGPIGDEVGVVRMVRTEVGDVRDVEVAAFEPSSHLPSHRRCSASVTSR
jgi:hypothetical protein